MQVEIIAPLVSSTIETFASMLNCPLKPSQSCLGEQFHPHYEISGVIQLTGVVEGAVVFSMDRNVAISAAERLLGKRPSSIDANVIDATGELANIVTGKAKAGLEAMSLKMSLPTVVVGEPPYDLQFEAPPLAIPFECEWGRIRLDVRFANLC